MSLTMGWQEGLRRAMLALFALLCAAGLLMGAMQGDGVLALLFALAGAVLAGRCPPPERILARVGRQRSWTLLTAACLVVKGTFVLLFRLEPEGDYLVFWEHAKALALYGTASGSRYAALFPHIMGYAGFLSVFLRLFGPGALLAPVLNVICTAASMWLLFRLCGEDCRRWAVCLLWIVCPSQTIYNAMALPEPLYTAILLGFLALVQNVEKKDIPAGKMALLGGFGGLLLFTFNALRPIASVPILALFIWLVLLGGGKGKAAQWLGFFAALLVVYFLFGRLWTGYLTWCLGEVPAGTPGYSLLVGLNQATGGSWNPADGEALFAAAYAPGATAQSAQREMLALAAERLPTVDLPKLLWDKLTIFFGVDSACLTYLGVLKHPRRARFVCNVFYDFLLLLALRGAWRMREERGPALLWPLYVLGLTLAQMLVEVAGRYHYSLIPMLILIGQYGLFPYQKKEGA